MDAVGRDTPVTLRAGPAGPNGGEVHGQRWPTEYRVGVTRTPAYLAAVASSAVPGLDAVAVRAARGAPGNRCDVGFVTDTQRRAWVVRVPTTSAIGAQLDTAADLLPLLNRRVPYSVPLPRGFLAVPEGRAVVYPYLHGRSVVLSEVIPGPGVAAEIGRAVAALHNVERAVFDEAGVPVYDAETCRTRHLGDLDRGAATGHVPTALLSRWERALEDVSAWRFAPTPVHADLSGGRFLVTFADDENPETASVRAVTGWEHAKVADPADDFAVLVAECSPETFESIVEAYSVARIERPDRHLRHRARLVSELRLLSQLLDAVHAAEPPLITRRAAELRALDERTANEPDLVGRPSPRRLPGCRPADRWPPTPRPVPRPWAEWTTCPMSSRTTPSCSRPVPRPTPPPSSRPRSWTAFAASRPRRAEPETPAQADSESWYEVLEPSPSAPTPDAEDVTLDEDLDEDLEPELEPEAQPAPESEPVAEDLAEDVVTEEAPKVDEPTPPTPAEPSDAEPADSTAPIKQARPRADRRRR